MDKDRLSRAGRRRVLLCGARLLEVSLDQGMVASFDRFLDELTRWNRRMNLTGLKEEQAIIVRHFLDSLTLVRYPPTGASLLDIGSGAGFPGLPLKIVRPDLRVVLLEASRKKTYFHRHVIRLLHLSGIEAVWGRTDQEEIRASLGNRFDVVVSRATMPLEVFLREGGHFVREGGTMIAMKGRSLEIPDLPAGLGLSLERAVSVDLPFDREKRHLVFFRKSGVSL